MRLYYDVLPFKCFALGLVKYTSNSNFHVWYNFFAVLAASVFAITELFDKNYVDKEVSDFISTGAVYSLPLFLIFAFLGSLLGELSFETVTVVIGLTAGGLYSLNLIMYLKGVSTEEISRFMPLLSLNTVIIAVLSAVIFQENLGVIGYVGLLSTVFGAFLISLENPLESVKEIRSGRAVLLAFGTASLIAVRDVILKLGTGSTMIWNLLLWMGVGGTLFSMTAFLIYRNKSPKKLLENQKLLAIGSMRSLAYTFYAVALSLGSVSVASAVLKLNVMFVFIGATLLTYSPGNFLNEEKDRKTIIQKLVASTLIVGGVLMMKLFTG